MINIFEHERIDFEIKILLLINPFKSRNSVIKNVGRSIRIYDRILRIAFQSRFVVWIININFPSRQLDETGDLPDQRFPVVIFFVCLNCNPYGIDFHQPDLEGIIAELKVMSEKCKKARLNNTVKFELPVLPDHDLLIIRVYRYALGITEKHVPDALNR